MVDPMVECWWWNAVQSSNAISSQSCKSSQQHGVASMHAHMLECILCTDSHAYGSQSNSAELVVHRILEAAGADGKACWCPKLFRIWRIAMMWPDTTSELWLDVWKLPQNHL